MNLVTQFNNLHNKKVTRKELLSLRLKAKKEKNKPVYNRLHKLLTTHKESILDIVIENPLKFAYDPGLNAVDKKIILPTLDYISLPDEDNDGLNGVSPDDIYSYITDLIINTIKKVGNLPWQKNWIGSGSDKSAKNYVSKKEYSGANFLLNFDVKFDENGNGYLVPIKFIQPYYLTFNQIREAKATLKKGSQGRRVIYYTLIFTYKSNSLDFKTTDRIKWKEFVSNNNLSKTQIDTFGSTIPVLKYYNVFRADDCTGLKYDESVIKQVKSINPIDTAQSIIDDYKNPPAFTYVGDKAFYQPAGDIINMPTISAFDNESSYYCTFFHEMIHSTGAEKRLKRDFSGKFGSKNYAFEELIAELGAVFLCSEAGILFSTVENSAKYLASWNKKLITELENDNRFFLKASAQSQKASNFILNRIIEVEKVDEVKVKIPVKKKSKIALKSENQYSLFDGLNGIEITTDFFKKMTVSALRKFTLNYYNENLKGKKVEIKKHLKEIVFTSNGGKKLHTPMYSAKASVIENLEEIIKNSTYNNFGNRKETDKKDVLGYLNFKSKVTIDGLKRHVRISVILYKNRKTIFKSFDIGNKKKSILPIKEQVICNALDGGKTLSNNKDSKINTKKTNNGLNARVNRKSTVRAAKEKKAEVQKKTTQVQSKNINKNSLAYRKSKANEINQVREFYTIENKEISSFLGKIEKKPKESVAITLAGMQGSGKSSFVFQLINDFAQNYKVGHASIEEHPESYLYEDKANRYWNDKAFNQVDAPVIKSMQDVYDLVERNDVIIIDSFSKLKELDSSVKLDKDLRKKFDGKLFIIIYQLTTGKQMRGGSDSQFDGDVVLFIEKQSDFTKNYVYNDKNRYQSKNLEDLKYNISRCELEKTIKEKIKLSFNVKIKKK